MYQILIPNIPVVGMHHWGAKQLDVGGIYKLVAEKNNIQDTCAVAVYEYQNPSCKRAYIISEWARHIQPVLQFTSIAVLKVNTPAVVLRYEKGPQHNCVIMLKCCDVHKSNIVELFDSYNVTYYMSQVS